MSLNRIPLAAVLLTLALLTPLAAPAAAQDAEVAEVAADGTGLLRVFVDCAIGYRCDRIQRFREQITFVEWVQEPQDADLLVLWTGQMAGAGFRYVFDFIGQTEDLEGIDDRLTFTSSVTDVEEEVLQALTRTIGAGIVRYLAIRGEATTIDVIPVAGGNAQIRGDRGVGGPGGASGSREDPWDYWIFNLRANGDIEEEDQRESTEFRFGGSANRTTESWKIDLSFFGNIDVNTFQLNDSTRIRNEVDDFGGEAVIVRSISDHWSWGGQVDVRSSVRLNSDLRASFRPAVEWNLYPWQDATRRRVVLFYSNGVDYVDYEETTVFQKDEETLWVHGLDIEYRAQEPWGQARAGVEANQILNRDSKYSVQFDGSIEYRLFRGLSLELSAGYEIIRDQIYLSGAGLDPDEIFLEQRALATGSRFEFGFGVSYRFGSIYNSIVNARFPSLGRMGR